MRAFGPIARVRGTATALTAFPAFPALTAFPALFLVPANTGVGNVDWNSALVDRSTSPTSLTPAGRQFRPFLGYTAESFLGRLCRVVLSDAGSRLQLRKVYENGMAEAVKAMVLAGHAIAWLPESSVRNELSRRTVQVIDIPDAGPMEVRIYRSLDRTRPLVEPFWDFLSANPSLESIACNQ